MKTFVIAESASSWRIGKQSHRHLADAKLCIHIAKDCGADAIKFQWVSDPRLMERRRHVPKGTYDILAWPEEWLRELAAECEEIGIEFMCTVFVPQDVATIASLVKRFKVASLEACDHAFVDAIAEQGKPVLISTGALDREQVSELMDHPPYWERCQYLLCTAGYPTPLAQLNLSILKDSLAFNGLSDHSGDVLTGALAVACGAEIIEVHFRLDRTPNDNPDYPHSHSPEKLKTYIANIRKAELTLGDGMKKVEECERALLSHRVQS